MCGEDEVWSKSCETSFDANFRQKLPTLDKGVGAPVLDIIEVEGSGPQCLNIGCFHKLFDRRTISNSELLQCHTFTKCIVCAIVAQGYTIQDLCSPAESFGVIDRICIVGDEDLNLQMQVPSTGKVQPSKTYT